MKQKTLYRCNSCKHTTVKWLGCCPECRAWNSIAEETTVTVGNKKVSAQARTTMQPLHSVEVSPQKRMLSGISEWDRVVGSGIMPGSFLILTGDPGIGKSTLLLQICYRLSEQHTVFYFSSEESLEQVKRRAARLHCAHDALLFSDQANIETIIATAEQHKPDVLIVDSIQNCYLSHTQALPGSTGQLREAAFLLMRLAKEHNIAIILTGHITKEGVMAGPKTLEHMVDGVFYLQGEDRWQTRVLRAVKNRFGAINELGFFQMQQTGLEEMPNINQHLLSDVSHNPGSVLVGSMEGSRPLLLEVQALTIASKLNMPQRVISGLDHKQAILIAAILEKYLKVKLSAHDIFLKVSGGFKIRESSSDLGIALALLSSYFQQPLPEQSIALGEISLTGQIKPINQIDMHIREAEKFGITQVLIAKNQKVEKAGSTLQRFQHVYELLKLFPEQ